MRPVYCCEDQGFGNRQQRVPSFGFSCGSNTSTWTMKQGSHDFTLCTKKCTTLYCMAPYCNSSYDCYMNRYNTCGNVPDMWKTKYCAKLNFARSRASTNIGLMMWIIYILVCYNTCSQWIPMSLGMCGSLS